VLILVFLYRKSCMQQLMKVQMEQIRNLKGVLRTSETNPPISAFKGNFQCSVGCINICHIDTNLNRGLSPYINPSNFIIFRLWLSSQQ